MAATRNKNTTGNYAAERFASERINRELMYMHAPNGQAVQTNYPGDGLLQGRIAGRDLAKNDCDIESFLFGIGSSNLEIPKPIIPPEITPLQSVSFIRKIPMVIPTKLGIEMNQRSLYLN